MQLISQYWLSSGLNIQTQQTNTFQYNTIVFMILKISVKKFCTLKSISQLCNINCQVNKNVMNVSDNVSTFSVLRLSASTCVCNIICQCHPKGDVPSLDACRAGDECLDHWFHLHHI